MMVTSWLSSLPLAVLDRFDHDPAEIRSRADDLLSRPPYTDAEPGWFSRALSWVGELAARALQTFIDALGATGRVGAWAIAVIGALLLAAVVWRLTRGTTLDPRSPEVPQGPSTRTSASWAQEARDHEADGRSRDAVRCWYAALVVGLVERGVIEDLPGRTVRELDAEVSDRAPRDAPTVAQAGAVFESVVYGSQPADGTAIETVRLAATSGAEVLA